MSIGLGFGLFAVLSIIRLRSAELDQQEVAYYFAALALGLLGGFVLDPAWLAPVLMAVVLLALFVGDHPRLFARYRVQSMTLDGAYTDEPRLVARLEELLGARVHRVKVRRVDLVEATTTRGGPLRAARAAERPAARRALRSGERGCVMEARSVDALPGPTRPIGWSLVDPSSDESPPPCSPGATASTSCPIGAARAARGGPRRVAAASSRSTAAASSATSRSTSTRPTASRTWALRPAADPSLQGPDALLPRHGRCLLEIKTRDARGRTVKERHEHPFATRDRLEARRTSGSSAVPAHRRTTSAPSSRCSPRATPARRCCWTVAACRATIDTDVGRSARDGNVAAPCRAWPSSRASRRARRRRSTASCGRMGYRPTRVSKFCTSLAALFPELPSNKWTRALRQPWSVRPAARPDARPLDTAPATARLGVALSAAGSRPLSVTT